MENSCLSATTENQLSKLIDRAFRSLKGQLLVDVNGIVLYFSKEHEKYLGIPKEEAVGRHVTEVVPNTRMHIVVETMEPECGMIFYYKHRVTGEITPSICNRIPIIEDGKVLGVMSETTFFKGFKDVDVLHEELKNMSFNPTTYRDVIDLNSGYLEKICGSSQCMSELKLSLPKFADFSLPVLITGETGTGKEVFANTLHQLSYRRMRPFVKINCAAIPAALLESELFGYESGAFSGASKGGKVGKFEYAADGTLLLDEIGDMPFELQTKLLRVLQEKEFERVGGLKTIPFNARVICTTNRDVKKLISEGKFREDLYYRINVLEITIPPLRDRVDDIEHLVAFFIKEMNYEEGTSIDGIHDDALNLLKSFNWPGNVRELRHVIQRACIMCGAGTLEIDDFSFYLKELNAGRGEDWEINFESDYTLDSAKSKAEIKAIKRALAKTNHNKSKAAEMLNIDRTALYSKMKRYGID